MIVDVDSINDPRLADFHEIKDKSLERRGLFIAEGGNVVRRLLQSDVRTRAVVLSRSRLEEYRPHIPPDVDTYVLPHKDVSQLLGFSFHAGVVGLGVIPASPPLGQVVPPVGPARVVVLPEISSAENLGTLIRLAAGLGAHAVVTGPRCTDPWMRRTVRVSMGTIFGLPVVRSTDLSADLASLRRDFGLTALGTVLSPAAHPLGTLPPFQRQAVLFGSEAQGLSEEEIAACDHTVTIPMHNGVDSLNVAIAAAIVLWEQFGAADRGR